MTMFNSRRPVSFFFLLINFLTLAVVAIVLFIESGVKRPDMSILLVLALTKNDFLNRATTDVLDVIEALVRLFLCAKPGEYFCLRYEHN